MVLICAGKGRTYNNQPAMGKMHMFQKPIAQSSVRVGLWLSIKLDKTAMPIATDTEWCN